MCTHDIFRAKEIDDYIGIMRQGRMVKQLTRQEFLSEDLEKLYLEYMNYHPTGRPNS